MCVVRCARTVAAKQRTGVMWLLTGIAPLLPRSRRFLWIRSSLMCAAAACQTLRYADAKRLGSKNCGPSRGKGGTNQVAPATSASKQCAASRGAEASVVQRGVRGVSQVSVLLKFHVAKPRC